MASPSPLVVDIVEQRIVQFKGSIVDYISYCIKVTHGDRSWSVFYSEDQINNLAKQLMQPAIEGYLYKKAENRFAPKQWNKRYFKFLGNALYYSNELSLEPNVFCSIYKKIEIEASGTDLHVSNLKALFEIHQKNGNTVYLRAPSQGDMLRWVDVLKGEKDISSARKQVSSAPVVRSSDLTPPFAPTRLYQRKEFPSVRTISLSAFENKINPFLQNLCQLYQTSDVLRSFLLVNAYVGEEFPQYRMILDALDMGDLATIKKLHEENGVPVIFSFSGRNSFLEACRLGRMPFIEYVFATEPESLTEPLLYKCDHFEQTGLHYASSSSLELALFLLSRCSVDKIVSMFGTWTPLHHLARAAKVIIFEQVDFVKNMVAILRNHINAADMVDNQTPLHICAKECNAALALILLQSGAKIEIQTNHGRTFMHILVQNTSTKSHDMTSQVLQHLYNSANSLFLCNKQIEFLETTDNEGLVAIQCAISKDPNSTHVTLLREHYENLENFKFKFIMSDILYVYNQQSSGSVNVMNTSIFQKLVEFICSTCSLNHYHHDIPLLIDRVRDLFARTEKSLLEVKISEKQRGDFMEILLQKCYHFIFSLFTKKKSAVDFILCQYLNIFQSTATRFSLGITDAFWQRVLAKEARIAQVQLASRRTLLESVLVKRGVDILARIPEFEKASEKINCVKEVLALFECQGDEEFSLLSYLMVKAYNARIQWSAEIDYGFSIL